MAKLGVLDMPLMQAIAFAASPRIREFTAFDLSILVWAFDVVNLGELLEDILPTAMEYFSKELEFDDECGMFWFDFANVVGARVDHQHRQEFDAVFRDRLLDSVTDSLTS